MGSFITTIVGSVAAVLLAGIALLIKKHRGHLPRWASAKRDFALIAAIALMLFAGVLIAYGGVGSWVLDALNWVRGILGPAGPVVFALVALGLLIKMLVALFKRPDEGAMTTAFAFPLVCATFSVGFFHQINTFLAPIAQSVAGHLSGWLGA